MWQCKSNIRSALLPPNVANQPRRFLSSDEFARLGKP
jgi:hypothetical protein